MILRIVYSDLIKCLINIQNLTKTWIYVKKIKYVFILYIIHNENFWLD